LHRGRFGHERGINGNQESVRVLIVDDHRLFTEALGLIIGAAPGVEVVGTVTSGRDAVHYARTEGVEVVLMDWRMPMMDGIETTRQLLAINPDARIILISSADEAEVETDATAAGVTAFLSKCGIADEVVASIRRAAAAPRRPAELPVLVLPLIPGVQQRAPERDLPA
jgi:NarL family two-component system response regulator LiaR